MGMPARGYSWEPFKPGNLVAVKSGARSPRIYTKLAASLVGALNEARPDLAGFPFAVSAWAVAETRAALLRAHLDNVGMFDDEGAPRDSTLRWVLSFERLASEQRKALGLDPRSSAELVKSRADAVIGSFDVEALKAKGRAALEANGQDQEETE
jgi:hypothetical protein